MNNTYQDNEEFIEKSFLILLIVITVTQFAVWGQQSVRFILTSIFPVEDQITTTPIEVLIGFGAMVASALVFAGSVMWWKKMPSAFSFITTGAIIFMIKNILDILNEIAVFGMTNLTVTMAEIDRLAASLGEQFFQLAFWGFIFFYFRHKIKKHVLESASVEEPMAMPQAQSQFTPQQFDQQ
tara:strand:+ start:936 stop:1481 length:546 start_codon:yes stop_codon:yes gene_type:complete